MGYCMSWVEELQMDLRHSHHGPLVRLQHLPDKGSTVVVLLKDTVSTIEIFIAFMLYLELEQRVRA